MTDPNEVIGKEQWVYGKIYKNSHTHAVYIKEGFAKLPIGKPFDEIVLLLLKIKEDIELIKRHEINGGLKWER